MPHNERAALGALPADDLWGLERKSDVDLDAVYEKDLGAFDLERPLTASVADDRQRRYRAVLRRVTLVDVTGRPDFAVLVKLVSDLLGR